MVFDMTPEGFEQLSRALVESPEIEMTTLTGTTGRLIAPDLELCFFYDGQALLTVTVLKRRSFKAKFASAALLEKLVTRLIDKGKQQQTV